MKSFSLLLVAVSVFAVSCERHEFDGPDGTKRLHEKHGAHDHDSHDGSVEHDDAHGKKEAH